jgi:hypothetical protein
MLVPAWRSSSEVLGFFLGKGLFFRGMYRGAV